MTLRDGSFESPLIHQVNPPLIWIQFRVSPLAEDAALATYIADVDTPPGTQPAHVRFAAGTVWVKQRGEWKCRFYQGTTVANEISTK